MVKRVLQIGDDHRQADDIRASIEAAGYSVVTLVGTRDDISAISVAAFPDLVVLSVRRPDAFILDQIRRTISAYPCPMVVFAKHSTDQLTRQMFASGVAGYIVDGFSADRLPAIFSLAVARFEEVQGLKKKLKNTQLALSERKVLEKAKGILMQKCGVSEDQAYRKLRNMAASGNMKIGQIAKNIISMESGLTSF